MGDAPHRHLMSMGCAAQLTRAREESFSMYVQCIYFVRVDMPICPDNDLELQIPDHFNDVEFGVPI